jgi:hypothetical protein
VVSHFLETLAEVLIFKAYLQDVKIEIKLNTVRVLRRCECVQQEWEKTHPVYPASEPQVHLTNMFFRVFSGLE